MADDKPIDKPTPASSRGQAWRSAPLAAGVAPTAAAGRTKKLVLFSFLFLALLGALIGFLFYIHKPTTPFLLSISMSDYSDPLFPPLPFAEQDSAGLEQYFDAEHRIKGASSQERALLLKEFDQLATRKDKHIVIHLRAHALSRGDKVYLIPSNARTDDSDTWIPLQDLLAKIAACPAPYKLLLLDLFGPIADPRLGQLDDDLASKVRPILDNRPDKDMIVVCACEPGQLSLSSEELQRSVFAYYLDLGLKGYADKNNRESVSAQALADYVESSVQRWAVLNRGLQQKPVVLTAPGKDFQIVTASKSARSLPDLPEPPAYPDWLADGWRLRKQWQDEKRYAEAPLAYREYEATLLRAEQQWWGGRNSNRLATEFGGRRESLKAKLDEAHTRAVPPIQPTPISLAQRNVKVDLAFLMDLYRDAKLSQTAKPEDKPALQTKWYSKEIEKPAKEGEKGKTLSYDQLATLVWKLVVKEDGISTRPTLLWLNELLTNFQGEHPRYVETMFIERLAKRSGNNESWLDPEFQQVLKLLVQLVNWSEQLLTLEPAALQWHQADIAAKGAELWRLQEKVFDSDWNKEDMSKLAEGYETLRTAAGTLQQGLDKLDEAAVVLPAALFYLTRADSIDETAWSDALTACQQLHKLLSRPVDQPWDELTLSDVTTKTDKLGKSMTALYRPVGKTATSKLVNDIPLAKPSNYADLRLPLELPAVLLDERVALLQGMRTLGKKNQDETNTKDTQGPPAGGLAGGQKPSSMSLGAPDRKARVVLALLKMVGVPMENRLDATDVPVDPLRLQEAWARKLPEMYRKAATPEEKLWLLIGVHPFAARDDTLAKDFDVNPAAVRLRAIRVKHWDWLAKYYEAASNFYLKNAVLKEFYVQASVNHKTIVSTTR